MEVDCSLDDRRKLLAPNFLVTLEQRGLYAMLLGRNLHNLVFFFAVPDVVVALVQVGILPWLFLTSRVSKLLCQKFGIVLVRS